MGVALYAAALRLYPADYRARFQREMLAAYTDMRQQLVPGACGQARAVIREFSGLVAGAAREWTAKWCTDRSARARVLPDCRMMRPAGVSRREWGAGLDAS
jgi:hypothetical protein